MDILDICSFLERDRFSTLYLCEMGVTELGTSDLDGQSACGLQKKKKMKEVAHTAPESSPLFTDRVPSRY
jgi:hypothetical protein